MILKRLTWLEKTSTDFPGQLEIASWLTQEYAENLVESLKKDQNFSWTHKMLPGNLSIRDKTIEYYLKIPLNSTEILPNHWKPHHLSIALQLRTSYTYAYFTELFFGASS